MVTAGQFAGGVVPAAFFAVLVLGNPAAGVPTKHAASGAPSAPTPLTVQLGWVPNAEYAGILVAKEMGYYLECGLDVKIEPIDPKTMDPIAPVLARPGVVGLTDGYILLNARRDGRPVKAFAATLQCSPLGLITLERSGITTVPQLSGKTVALQSDAHGRLETLLRFNGMDPSKVRTKEIGNETTSLASGVVDAQLGYLIDERIALEQKGVRVNVMPGYANGYVDYSEVCFTGDAFFAASPGILSAFLEATNRGWHEAFLHPGPTARMIVRRYNPTANVDYQERSLGVIQSFATHESDQLGMMRHETWRESADLFNIDPSVTDALVDYSILNDIYGKLR